MKVAIYIIGLVLSFQGLSQYKEITLEEYEKEAKLWGDFYMNQEYAIDLLYTSYTGTNSPVPYETIKGYVQKKNEMVFANIQGMQTITTNEIKLTVDSNSQKVALFYGNNEAAADIFSDQYKQFKKLITSIKKMKDSEGTHIEITYNEYCPISKTTLLIDQNNHLKTNWITYSEPREYEDANGNIKTTNVSLKVAYTNYRKKAVYPTVALNDIITSTSGDISLQGKYQAFELIDFRPKN